MLAKLTHFKYDENSLCVLGDEEKFCVQLDKNGRVLNASAGDILISRTLGNFLEGGLGRLFLRIYDGNEINLHELQGPQCELIEFSYSSASAYWSGAISGCSVRLTLRVDAESQLLIWEVELENMTLESIQLDTVWVQDLGVANRDALLSNEAYVAHYLDTFIFQDEHCGPVLSFRQNLKQSGKHPWIMATCLSGASSFATDAFDVYGSGFRCGKKPSGLIQKRLLNRLYQFEFSCAALQSNPKQLEPGDHLSIRYAIAYKANHPEVSSEADKAVLKRVITVANQKTYELQNWTHKIKRNILTEAYVCHGKDLNEAELQDLFPFKWRHVERHQDKLLSFFCDSERHVVTRAKEVLVERPHGNIIVGNAVNKSIRGVLATTVYMSGVFSAQMVYGNTSFHKMNSLPREPLGLSRAPGMRIYFETDEGWEILGTPSVFEMIRDMCRWIYVLEDETIEVCLALGADRDSFNFTVKTTGVARRFLLSNELVVGETEAKLKAAIAVTELDRILTINDCSEGIAKQRGLDLTFGMQWSERSEIKDVGGSELLGAQGVGNLLVLRTAEVQSFDITITASLDGVSDVINKLKREKVTNERNYWTAFNRDFNCTGDMEGLSRLSDALRWYSHNALIHYASPHGLEQYSGAAWGTRDACQGPFEYFIAQQHKDLAKNVLLKVLSKQYFETGDLPQWFMHDVYHNIAQQHSHGDIVVWPLKALALYLESTRDVGILDIQISYLSASPLEKKDLGSVSEHICKLLDRIEHEFIPNTALLRYGGGDWDDSLQPANTNLANRLVSGWTVALLAQALQELTDTLDDSPLRERTRMLSSRVKADFRRHLLINGQVAGFILYDEAFRNPEPLLHPNDTRTGIKSRLIPMTRSILAGLLTPEEAIHQIQVIDKNLKFPDGVRLMDKPTQYSGGLETFFKRAESAANFGREIGLQYVHAHIRYAETLAKLGRAEEFYNALLVICPVAIKNSVRNADYRQSNMYFSSSDGAFINRLEASENFQKIKDGSIAVKGGWRLYSSGPGLYIGLVIRQFFGLREYGDEWVFDPVLPKFLDGVQVSWTLFGMNVEIIYRVKNSTFGPSAVSVGGIELDARREQNPYRKAGLLIKKHDLEQALKKEASLVVTI